MSTDATLVFMDEVGFSLKGTINKSWSVVGHTPLIPMRANWSKLSTIGGITSHGQFLQQTHPGSITAVRVVAFLQHLLRHVTGEVVVVLDHAKIHQAKIVQQFLDAHPRLSMVWLPTYAPELNPIEWLWASVKRHWLANCCLHDLAHLKQRLRLAWHTVRRKHIPLNCFQHRFPNTLFST